MQSLTTCIDKLEALPQSASASKPQSTQEFYLRQAIQLLPWVPSNLQISGLDLAKNFLWIRITSAAIPLPLPLDSCCSLSLVSQAHADAICNVYPTMQLPSCLRHCQFQWQIPMLSFRP